MNFAGARVLHRLFKNIHAVQPNTLIILSCFVNLLLAHRHTERSILKKKEDRENEWSLTSSSSRDELENNVLLRMKSVTNASDDVCVSLLEANSYDLKTSVEAYLASS